MRGTDAAALIAEALEVTNGSELSPVGSASALGLPDAEQMKRLAERMQVALWS